MRSRAADKRRLLAAGKQRRAFAARSRWFGRGSRSARRRRNSSASAWPAARRLRLEIVPPGVHDKVGQPLGDAWCLQHAVSSRISRGASTGGSKSARMPANAVGSAAQRSHGEDDDVKLEMLHAGLRAGVHGGNRARRRLSLASDQADRALRARRRRRCRGAHCRQARQRNHRPADRDREPRRRRRDHRHRGRAQSRSRRLHALARTIRTDLDQSRPSTRNCRTIRKGISRRSP